MKSRGLNVFLTMLFICGLLIACGGSDDNSGNTAGSTYCDGNTCYLTGTFTENLNLTADKNWVLKGGVFIGDDKNETIITIEPGTTIYGESATRGMLVITRGSKIMAEGTKDAPIVFTSSKTKGERARGDWGGLIINGLAPVNSCHVEDDDGNIPEGTCEAFGEGGTGFYGGDKPKDNSGVLRYVRVEFAGTLISPDNELNGIAFQGVGSGTTAEYLHVHMNKDDGVEFFGGTVNVKHVLVTGPADDMFDWTDGWKGKAQFVVLQQYDDTGDQGIEADNNAENNAATPRSKPTLSNFTIIGSPDNKDSDIGVLLREGTAAHIHNFIVTGFNEACIDFDNTETFDNAYDGSDSTDEIVIENTIINCKTNFKMDDEEDEDENPLDDPWNLEDFVMGMTGIQEADPKINDPYNFTNPDFSLASDSPAKTGASVPSDSFFESVGYIGAIGDDDWTQGWTIRELN